MNHTLPILLDSFYANVMPTWQNIDGHYLLYVIKVSQNRLYRSINNLIAFKYTRTQFIGHNIIELKKMIGVKFSEDKI